MTLADMKRVANYKVRTPRESLVEQIRSAEVNRLTVKEKMFLINERIEALKIELHQLKTEDFQLRDTIEILRYNLRHKLY
jgi:hypothetical protein